MGMRTKSGVSNHLLSSWLTEISTNPPHKIQKLLELNLLELSDNRIRATSHGMQLLNSILPDLTDSLFDFTNKNNI